ncbi:MAG: RNA ligase family protein, partial [Clostridia bacterium]
IQGELIGEGIQGNIYKLKGQKIMFYNCFDIDKQQYWSYEAFIDLITKTMGLETVPILDDNYVLPEKAEDIFLEADKTYSVLNSKQLIEGFVFVANDPWIKSDVRITRSAYNRLSFKAKSRTYDMNKR